jgi:aconitate hydratase
LTDKEVIEIAGLNNNLKPRKNVTVRVKRDDGSSVDFKATVRIDTPWKWSIIAMAGSCRQY